MATQIVVLEPWEYPNGTGKYLDGRTADGTVGLAPSTEGFSGTKWELSYYNIDPLGNVITLKCLGDIDGPRYLSGRIADGTVGLVDPPPYTFSGTIWKIEPTFTEDVKVILCLGDIDGSSSLQGSVLDETVRLGDFGSSYWKIRTVTS